MAKSLFTLLLTSILLCFSGCSFDPRYEAEKALWEVSQLERKLVEENPEGLEDEHRDQIIAALKRVTTAAPTDPLAAKAHFRIFQLQVKQENFDKAHATLDLVSNSFADNDDILAQAAYWKGRLYATDGQIDQAMAQYQSVMEQAPMTKIGLEMPLQIIRFYKDQGMEAKVEEATSQARQHYHGLIEEFSGTSVAGPINAYMLKLYTIEEAWDDMVEFWDDEIKKQIKRSDLVQASLAKANVLAAKMNKPAEAEAIYQELINKYPDADIINLVRLRLGYLQIARTHLNEARDTLGEILVKAPDNEQLRMQSYLGLAMIAHRQERHDEVITFYDTIQNEFADNPNAWKIPLVKYSYYKRLAQPENAQRTLETAIADYKVKWNQNLADDDADTVANGKIVGLLLLQCFIQQENWDAAMAHIEAYSSRFPEDARFSNLLANLDSEDPDSLQKALQQASDNPESVQAMQPPM